MIFGRTREWLGATAELYQQEGLWGAPLATGASALFGVYQLLDFASSTPFVAAALLGGTALLSTIGVLPAGLSITTLLAHHGLSQLVQPVQQIIGSVEIAGASAQVGKRGLRRIPLIGEIADGMKEMAQERREGKSRRFPY